MGLDFVDTYLFWDKAREIRTLLRVVTINGYLFEDKVLFCNTPSVS